MDKGHVKEKQLKSDNFLRISSYKYCIRISSYKLSS